MWNAGLCFIPCLLVALFSFSVPVEGVENAPNASAPPVGGSSAPTEAPLSSPPSPSDTGVPSNSPLFGIPTVTDIIDNPTFNSLFPTISPTALPLGTPTREPTPAPTAVPTTPYPTETPTFAPTNTPTENGDLPASVCISSWMPYSSGVSSLCSSCTDGSMFMVRTFLNVPECAYVYESNYSFFKVTPCSFPCPTYFNALEQSVSPQNITAAFDYISDPAVNVTYLLSLLREAMVPATYTTLKYG
jgi:hypothetical protein